MISSWHRPRMLSVACGLAALTFFGAACGGRSGDEKSEGTGSKGSTSRDGVATTDQQLKFAQCMRKNGVDMPDPKPGQASTAVSIGGKGVSPEKIEKAMKACQNVAGIPETKPLSPEQQDKLVKFTACMREHGVDMPDPDFSGGARKAVPLHGKADRDRFDEANRACARFQ